MTISNDRKKLIDKIVKLLAMAESTNFSEEADTARHMATDMMVKHSINITEAQVKAEMNKTQVKQTTKVCERFDRDLSNAVAKFNGCASIYRTGWEKKASFIYVGREVDVEATVYMMDIVKQQRKTAYSVHSDKYIEVAGKAAWNKDESDWRMWMNGFTMGVHTKLQELTEAVATEVQERGLVPVNSRKLAVQWYNANEGKTHKSHGKMRGGSEAGFGAGKAVSLNKGVGTKSTTKQIG